jgi:UDP-N-acetylglucosamine--N-acetylmuramyl-(pentapeptide) pyrophosphoryl-undecaprenol N-acetylglucosamine transferase
MTTLLVANIGGHLTQLHTLRPRLPIQDDVLWVTSESPQSRSLLGAEDVVYLGYPRSRSLPDVAVNAARGLRQLPVRGVRAVVTTGANLALSVLPRYAAAGVACHFIESATRVEGPSLSGRLMARVPRVSLYTQNQDWADGRWAYGGTVFDGFSARPRAGSTTAVRRVVVTLGSSEGFGFRRAVERLLEILPADVEVLWQTGVTDVRGLGIAARPSVPGRELDEALRAADVVVAHAGTGSALSALSAGHVPVLLPRSVQRGEHVDGHQDQIARMLGDRGLALVRDASALTWDDLRAAAAQQAVRTDAQPFVLRA